MVPYEDAYESGFEDMYRRIPDISKLERAIGWERSKHLVDVLEDVIADQQGVALS
jgi:UDP-glucose 4-epimerase